jgi:hypothetical protein
MLTDSSDSGFRIVIDSLIFDTGYQARLTGPFREWQTGANPPAG